LGIVGRGERPTKRQAVGLFAAGTGVAIYLSEQGTLPWVALSIGGTGAAYGFVKKVLPVPTIPGLCLESLLLGPAALLYLLALWQRGQSHWQMQSGAVNLLAVASGLLTLLALYFYVGAARRLTLGLLGMLQYLQPFLVFLVALAFGERPTGAQLHLMAAVVLGMAVYAWPRRDGS
jgi:chloramphenicol-sensitive protein RarD